MVTYVNCEICNKQIELKKWRTICIRCRNKIDKERSTEYYKENIEHIRELNRERYARKVSKKGS